MGLMQRTVEGTIDTEGKVELKEPVQLPSGRRALVTILDEEAQEGAQAERPRNGKELVAYWRREGLIGTHPEIKNSQELARKIRRQAEQRRH